MLWGNKRNEALEGSIWGTFEGRLGLTYIVTSTSSMVIFPWMAFIAVPAFFIAARVSWLMFADSIE